MFKILMLIGMIFIDSVFAAETTPNEPDSPDYLVQKIKRMEITIAYSKELEKISIQAVSARDEERMGLDSVFEKKYVEMVKMVAKENGKPLLPLYSIKTQAESVVACGHFKDINPKFIKLRDSFKKKFTDFFDDD